MRVSRPTLNRQHSQRCWTARLLGVHVTISWGDGFTEYPEALTLLDAVAQVNGAGVACISGGFFPDYAAVSVLAADADSESLCDGLTAILDVDGELKPAADAVLDAGMCDAILVLDDIDVAPTVSPGQLAEMLAGIILAVDRYAALGLLVVIPDDPDTKALTGALASLGARRLAGRVSALTTTGKEEDRNLRGLALDVHVDEDGELPSVPELD